jgi:hypothetical protein
MIAVTHPIDAFGDGNRPPARQPAIASACGRTGSYGRRGRLRGRGSRPTQGNPADPGLNRPGSSHRFMSTLGEARDQGRYVRASNHSTTGSRWRASDEKGGFPPRGPASLWAQDGQRKV